MYAKAHNKTMSEKTPRIKPHATIELARKGMEAHQYPKLPVLNPDKQRKIGQMSITDGLTIIREAPAED